MDFLYTSEWTWRHFLIFAPCFSDMSSAWTYSEFPGEGLVQERLLQRLQKHVLPLVEAGEALGFGFVPAGNGCFSWSRKTRHVLAFGQWKNRAAHRCPFIGRCRART
jgi:hypothetical protein